MKRAYVLVPLGCMTAFIGFERWSAHSRLDRPVGFSGEAPDLWRQVDDIKPANVRLVEDEFDARDGTADAERDIAGGRLVVLESGDNHLCGREYAEVWWQQYGVEVEPYTGTERYFEDYWRVMYAHIRRQFGPDVFDLVWHEAIRRAEFRRTEEANQPPQRNAGSRPFSGGPSASETSSSLGPRG